MPENPWRSAEGRSRAFPAYRPVRERILPFGPIQKTSNLFSQMNGEENSQWWIVAHSAIAGGFTGTVIRSGFRTAFRAADFESTKKAGYGDAVLAERQQHAFVIVPTMAGRAFRNSTVTPSLISLANLGSGASVALPLDRAVP